MNELPELLADCDAHGIRLLPAGDGGLIIDAPQDALTPGLMKRLKAHKGELLVILRPEALVGDPDGNQHDLQGGDQDGLHDQEDLQAGLFHGQHDPGVTAWCRCGSNRFIDVPIHDGQSTRRDCAGCGRFLGFPWWYSRKNVAQDAPQGHADPEQDSGHLKHQKAATGPCSLKIR